jgi:hypothetical protein
MYWLSVSIPTSESREKIDVLIFGPEVLLCCLLSLKKKKKKKKEKIEQISNYIAFTTDVTYQTIRTLMQQRQQPMSLLSQIQCQRSLVQ